MQPSVFPWEPVAGYELLDSGDGRKLERFGDVVIDRPDPQALWRPQRAAWKDAHLVFVREDDRGGRFETRARLPRGASAESWELRDWFAGHDGLVCHVRPTPFKHVGLFPEQSSNWRFVAQRRAALGPAPELLNLFGYTGLASVVAARAGYRVTHVDASKTSLAWCRENLEASGVRAQDVRLVCDDALDFAQREVRRERKYAAVLLDPPHFGRGPKGQRWQLEEGLAPLLEAVRALLDERALVVLSAYAVGYSPLAFANLLGEFDGGTVEAGELALPESAGKRLLPCGYCARFERGLA
jgi:23S rRNA (cytosine1962-C5)-methyltransferase